MIVDKYLSNSKQLGRIYVFPYQETLQIRQGTVLCLKKQAKTWNRPLSSKEHYLGDNMNQNNEKIEKILEKRSNDSIDDLITYVLFRIQSPIEDYYWAIDFLRDMYPKKKDIRLAIIGAYLSSTWLSVDTNPFIPLLNEHILTVDNQTKAIIYYLYAYDLYLKCDDNYPKQYSDALRKSVFYSKRFVLNYVRLAEVAEKKEAILLLDLAIKNVEKVWTEEELLQEPEESFITYESFIDEFILGVDISSFEYESLLKKRKSLRYKLF